MIFDQVTPMASYCPKRHYILTNETISCYNVSQYEHTTDGTRILIDPTKLLWKVELPSKEAAESFMTDLYYGEYTGA